MHVVTAFTVAIFAAEFPVEAWEWASRGPLMVLAAYALAVGYVNRSRVTVSPRGLERRFGPLPACPESAPTPRAAIHNVYVRHAWQPTRHGGYSYWTAGVDAYGGLWIDLAGQLATEEEAWLASFEIANALAWTHPVAAYSGLPPRRDQQEVRAALAWSGALFLSLIWTGVGEALLRP